MPISGYRASDRLVSTLRECFSGGLFLLEKESKSSIYTVGQKDSYLYLIDRGTVKVSSYSENGKSCILSVYTANDIFGESCVFQPVRRETTTAMTDVRLLKIPRLRFMEVVAARGLVDDWSRYQARRMQALQETITLLVTVDSVQRLAAILIMLADQLGIDRGDRTIITSRFTHEDLAQIVGTTRSRVGLFLKQFQETGMIHVSRDSYLVVKQSHLRAFLSDRARQTA
ncbi:Crp/Fnr family transcriptional regulator [Actinocorallia lasiicapitis]